MKKGIITCLLAVLVLANLTAAEYYVSKETGKNGNAGTKDAPLRTSRRLSKRFSPVIKSMLPKAITTAFATRVLS